MAKVFRLHEGDDNIVDWQDSSRYGTDVINQIQDPDGATARKEITSIPSPFARIDLVKTAFKTVTDNNDLDGNTIYHKMVSDSLDVGEIFFNAEKLKDKIKILIWDKTTDLQALTNSSNLAHKTLGETLDIYIQQDATVYNFNKMTRIYLLNYIGQGKPAPMNIIGATSPITLFFSSSNDLNYISNHIQFGQDKVFDDMYQPLYKRDFEYIKYLFAFQKNDIDFASNYPEVNVYLNQTYARLRNDEQQKIDALDVTNINSYDPLFIDGANQVEILGKSFHKKPVVEEFDSDFEINSVQYKGKKPLVLPVDSGNTYIDLRYTQSYWHKTDRSPYFDITPWQNRTLPIVGDKYPYLTISDLLEDTIIRTPYEFNDSAFFDGNYGKNKEHSFLLPIRDLFFEFFSIEDLQSTLSCGKKMFELTKNSGGVKAVLRIPIRKGYIQYERMYFENNTCDLSENKGGLLDKKFGLGLYSNIEFNSDENPHYRIALFDKGSFDVDLSFSNGSNIINSKANITRRKKDELSGIETYVLDTVFDRINVSIGQSKGIIIPKFIKKGRTAQFTFAVDFGTTNTHIEYSIDGSPSKPFDISCNEKQIQRLHLNYRSDIDIQYAFENNFIPDTVSDNDMYGFPMRTVFAEFAEINYQQPIFTLGSGNIPFRYEKSQIPPYNKIKTDLKWSVKEQQRIKLYIENLYLLMRNKVLLNGGSLSQTKIIWFYPASMTEAQCNQFKTIWQNLYKEYFGSNIANVITMSESVAPYNFYKKKKGAKSNVVTIDIGGASTDIYVVENNVPRILSSFRFASNAIFGDGYNWDSDSNGFVQEFFDGIFHILEDNNLSELQQTLKAIESSKKSADIIAFFFSLSMNKQVKDKNVASLDFLQKLSNHVKLKYIFIIFYSAIIYYVANLMKAKGITTMPNTIAFSGNGSKTLRVLSSDNITLAKFLKIIIETVFGETYPAENDLEIIFEENPKEATCKGGILNPTPQSFDDIEDLKLSLLGVDLMSFTNSIKYSEIDNDVLKDISNQVLAFVDFVFNLHKNNNSFYVKKFDVDGSIMSEVHEICKKNLLEYMKLGVEHKKDEIKAWGADGVLEETLFFYPIVGLLNNLAREINKR